jgi:hypothetical protein
MWSDSDKIGTSDLVLSSSLDCSALERAELSLKRCRFFLLCPLLKARKSGAMSIHTPHRSTDPDLTSAQRTHVIRTPPVPS